MKYAVIVDNGKISRWQASALKTLGDLDSLLLLNCTNTRIRRRPGKHFLYFVLNRFSIRNRWTTKIPVTDAGIQIAEMVDFQSEYYGTWQRLPQFVLERVIQAQPDIIFKFGMSLLRVPHALATPILSYHHGDPEFYRGRPAGFWETMHGTRKMGQIVQVITNKLDAGAVVAFAETRVFPHSYRSTMQEAYRHSPLLLARAVSNVLAGRTLEKDVEGRNYRLPGNLTMLRFLTDMGIAAVRRLVYGALFEKRWRVSRAAARPEDVVTGGAFPPREAWSHLPLSHRHSFHADAFFSKNPDGILVEAMNARTGRGEILFISDNGEELRLTDPTHHWSYPSSITENGKSYIVPEIAQWSAPRIFKLEGGRLQLVAPLKIAAPDRIIDPTLYRQGDRLYLFGNKASLGTTVLCLWSSASLFDEFVEHPASPILISPLGGRMAGGILEIGSNLHRLGQDGEDSYGDGVALFRIEELGPTTYREVFERKIRFSGVRGPHTLILSKGEVLFDWYKDRFHPLSGLRRLRGRLKV